MNAAWSIRVLGALSAGFLAFSLVGCDSTIEVPSSWAEMGIPLGDGELRRNEEQSKKRISIDHEDTTETQKVCMRYRQALEKAGMELASNEANRDDPDYMVRTFDDAGEMVKLRCINALDKSVVQLEYDDGKNPARRARVGD